jgi:hypothetical protein
MDLPVNDDQSPQLHMFANAKPKEEERAGIGIPALFKFGVQLVVRFTF